MVAAFHHGSGMARAHLLDLQYGPLSDVVRYRAGKVLRDDEGLGVGGFDEPPLFSGRMKMVERHNDAACSDDSRILWMGLRCGPRSAWSISADLFDGFDAPVYPLFGNHDYGGFDCDTPDDVYFEWHRDLFDKFYGREPYYAVDLHGFRFLLLDGQLGLRCQEKTGEAAYGRTQLDWVADQIDEGLPTFVLSHYMSLIWSSEETTGPNPDLDTVVAERSDVVQGIFAGHTHRWLNGSTTSPGGVEEWVLGAVRYDPDNFWVLELDPSDGSWAIVDFDKHRYSTTCADTYRYDDGAPRKMADAPETGDCVALSDFEDLP